MTGRSLKTGVASFSLMIHVHCLHKRLYVKSDQKRILQIIFDVCDKCGADLEKALMIGLHFFVNIKIYMKCLRKCVLTLQVILVPHSWITAFLLALVYYKVASNQFSWQSVK